MSMFSPSGSPAGARPTNSAGRRNISSPATTKVATPSRVVRTPNRGGQLVQLESSEREFNNQRRDFEDTSVSEESVYDNDEILDETEQSRRNSKADAAPARVSEPPMTAHTPATITPAETPPPRQSTLPVVGSSVDLSPASSRSVTPVTPVQVVPGVPPPSKATGDTVSTTGSAGNSRNGKPRARPAVLNTNAVESPASPENVGSDGDEAAKPPKTTATETKRQPEVKINAETPAAQRAQQQARASAKAAREEASAHPSTPPRVTLGNKHLIGTGSFGTVYRALDLETNRSVAVKEIRLQHYENPARAKKELETLEREIRVMQKLAHPNIVEYLGYTHGEGTFNIHMEYVSCGTVSSLLRTFGPLQSVQAALFTKQILAGLQYLHSKRIAHRDLKGDNLFVDTDGTLKLGDFGTAKELQTLKSSGFTSVAGTPYFMAPEVVKNGGHGLEADIWSVGCCVIQMLGGQPPFKGFDNQITVMFQVSKGEIEPQIPANIPEDARDFILTCCRVEPKSRPSVAELLNHPWLAAAPPVPSHAQPAAAAVGPSTAPATRAHARAHGTPPRPSVRSRPTSSTKDTATPDSSRVSPSPPEAPIPAGSRTSSRNSAKETPGSASRGVAAARQLRKQNERPTGASAGGSRRTGTPQRVT